MLEALETLGAKILNDPHSLELISSLYAHSAQVAITRRQSP